MVRRGNIKIDETLQLQGGIAVTPPPTGVATYLQYHLQDTGGDPIHLLHQAAIKILSGVGIMVRDEKWRKEIMAAGCQALPNGRLALSEKIILQALSTAPRTIHRPAQDKHLAFEQNQATIFFAVGGSASHLYEPTAIKQATYRPITSADSLAMVKIAHAMPLYDMLGFFAKPDILASELGSIEQAYDTMVQQLYDHNAKPFVVELHNHHVMPALLKKFPDLPQRAALGLSAFLPNLSLDSDLAASLFDAIAQGMVIENRAVTIAAATAPATVAGSITLAIAMNLAGLVLTQIIAPGAPFVFGFVPYTSDLKQGTTTTGSAETMVAQQLAVRVARFYQIPAMVSTTQTSAKLPDNQSGIEKSLGLMGLVQTALNQHCGLVVGQSAGLLGDGQIISKNNLITDHDMLAMVKRAIMPPMINDANIQAHVIERVLGKGSHFFAEVETRQIMKSQYLYPMAQDRLSLSSWLAAGEFTADKLAQEIVEKLMK